MTLTLDFIHIQQENLYQSKHGYNIEITVQKLMVYVNQKGSYSLLI
jgi:hypothetical protein